LHFKKIINQNLKTMKKLQFLLLAICALFFAACSSSKSDSPKGVVVSYLESIKSGNYEKAVKCFYFKEEMKETEMKALAAKLEEGYGKDGGLVKYEIVSEEVEQNEEENVIKGRVEVKLYYKEGKEKEETIKTVKNNGEWKIDFSVK
jgi:hypothetical protein